MLVVLELDLLTEVALLEALELDLLAEVALLEVLGLDRFAEVALLEEVALEVRFEELWLVISANERISKSSSSKKSEEVEFCDEELLAVDCYYDWV